MASAPLVAVVNSSDVLVQVLRELLEQEGYASASAHAADVQLGREDFLAFVDTYKPEAIIWDVSPPYDDSWRFLQLLRQAEPIKGIPFVVTTTNKARLEELVGKTEAIEIVGKPFDLEQIVDAVKRALRRRA